MKIAILSRNKNLYTTRRLQEAALHRGHKVEIIDYVRCYINITSKQPTIHYDGKNLTGFDAIIPRISPKNTFYGTAIVRQFETQSIYSINSSMGINRSRDKLRALQLLGMKGISMPQTGIAHSSDDLDDLIQLVGEPPLIIKLIQGTQGVGVLLAETKKAAESIIQAFMGLNANIIVQEYIKEAKGADIRCLVIGDKVVAAMKRQAAPGEFRSNVHRGGKTEIVQITRAEREIAIKAAKIMGLRLAGVDILRAKHGPLVMEVNSSPGLEGIENATKKDIANMIIHYLEKHAKPISPKSRYQG